MEEAEYQQRAAELALRLARPDIRQVQPTLQQDCHGSCQHCCQHACFPVRPRAMLQTQASMREGTQ